MIEEPVEDNVEEDKAGEDSDSDRTYLPESDEENDFEYSADGDKLTDSSEPLEEALTNQLNPDMENIDEPQPFIERLMSKGWTFMADREKGSQILCYAYVCLFQTWMWAAARSCTTADFEKFMELVKKEMQKLIDGCK
ncbi:uncharacterized protein [Nicotiana sylvestris]|uniref:uncharacterized protein n=1 Tax=Nicotiana sylvestris TaxID=4096 RepID=UPI00388C3A62